MKRDANLFLLISIIALWSCEKEAPQQIVLKDPTISVQHLPETISRISSNTALFMVQADDPQGIADIQEVRIAIRQSGKEVTSGLMWDDGKNGDIIANNGTFTYAITPNKFSLTKGEIFFSFQAQDMEGNLSPEVEDTALVIDPTPNEPPEILEVAGPDTISRSQNGVYLLTALVSDPQGLSDIQRVFFNSFHPDGAPATGNPFLMYDTGDNGDAQAGDGTYSFQFVIGPTNDIGQYRFEIQAQDKDGAKSEIVVYIITVIA